jgi:hypothetical protein
MNDLAIVTLDAPVSVVPIAIGYNINLNGLTGFAIGWGSTMSKYELVHQQQSHGR